MNGELAPRGYVVAMREPGTDMRGISRCAFRLGWHVYMAGPCFDTHEEAIAYRDELDREGITWKPQAVTREPGP